jgi:hypothetical protein
MDERIVALTRLHDDVATSAAIAAGRSAARHKLLSPERHAAIAAVARLDSNCGFINEHRYHSTNNSASAENTTAPGSQGLSSK